MSEGISVKLPDGSHRDVPSNSTGAWLAEQIGPGLARSAIAMDIDGTVTDLSTELRDGVTVKFLTFNDKEGQEVFWHSTAHMLAQAVLRLFPEAKPTIGPPLSDGGFYYDFANLTLQEEDLKRIQDEMKKIGKENFVCKRIEYSDKSQAQKAFVENKYKQEIINESNEQLSAYEQGEFTDLCRGPHIPRTGIVKAIWLSQIAGAYWRADAKNEQLTRIYGISFPDKKMLSAHKQMVEEAKRRDHRRIAQQMELYTINENIGPGLIIWLPNGNIIKDELENWAKKTEKAWGYQRVTTPIITKEDLFYTSEHLPHYADSMYKPMDIDGEKYYIKPMNCPFHHMVFSARTRSYRELPFRVAEYGWCHRYEQSGAIFGLMRVRGMQMNDAHIYCTKEQAVDEFLAVCKLHEYYYQTLGITDYRMVLALRDPTSDKYHGEEDMWLEAEALMKEAMDKSGIPYTVEEGGAAFYGPKIDFEIKSAIGREFTASTNQIDLFMPQKFGLKYTGEDGQEHTPVCIHRAPLGTHERFIGFLIEHFAGRFPLWLAPEQVAVLPISADQQEYAEQIAGRFANSNIRVSIEAGSETLNKRIRDCQLRQIPVNLIVGQKEVENQTVALRTLDGKTSYGLSLAEVLKKVSAAVENRSLEF